MPIPVHAGHCRQPLPVPPGRLLPPVAPSLLSSHIPWLVLGVISSDSSHPDERERHSPAMTQLLSLRSAVGRRHFRYAGKVPPSRASSRCAPMPNRELIAETLVSSCGSSMDDDEEIDSSLRPFDSPLKMELQLHEKSERCKLSSKDKKSGSKISKSSHNSPTHTDIAEDTLQL
ncbi:hypothetical protein Cgig2_000925 [Carnegiea gigantea]|uniref:Uncharacterized protein n=1 Tax=Carnegiea gigantea TaxID=171969 RepID=A0A9Q1QKJ9_9CARY|nr:hypothetical protein Cgig2_000925 [Carnegiea gigantea]